MRKKSLFLSMLIICLLFTNISYCDEIYEIDSNSYNNEISPLATYVDSAYCDFYISGGYAYCEGSVDGVSGVTNTKLLLKFQVLSSGTWKTICSWSKTGGNSCSMSDKKQAVTKGHSYRLYCEATAKTETIIVKSATRNY